MVARWIFDFSMVRCIRRLRFRMWLSISRAAADAGGDGEKRVGFDARDGLQRESVAEFEVFGGDAGVREDAAGGIQHPLSVSLPRLVHGGRRVEGPVEGGRLRAGGGVEVDVARAHGESVGFAHDRARFDAHVEVEVAHEAADDGDLMRILLPEIGGVRAHDAEQFRDDGRDAVEVVRSAGRAVEHLGDAGNVDAGSEAVGIDLGCFRGEEDVDARLFCARGVVLLIARVAAEVFVRAELGRVDEERDDDEVGSAGVLRASARGVRRGRRPWWGRGRRRCFARASRTAARTSGIVRRILDTAAFWRAMAAGCGGEFIEERRELRVRVVDRRRAGERRSPRRRGRSGR